MTEDAGSPFRYSYTTHEAGEAHDVLRRLYVGHDFRLHRVGRRFTYQQEAAGAGPIVVGRVRYGMDADIRLEPLDHLLIIVMRTGRLETRDRRDVTRTGPGDVLLHQVGRPLTNICLNFDLDSVNLDRATVTEVAAARTGIDPAHFRFEAMTPVSVAMSRLWRDTTAYLTQIFTGPQEHWGSPLAVRAAADLAASVALATFPNTAMAVSRHSGGVTLTAAPVRRAVSFIETHAGEPITATRIAEAARVTPRALQAAFRRHLGITPTAYLRRARLDRAHRDLTAAGRAAGDTVAAIARRWGYLHTGRFAADYRAAYGRSPGDTLRD
ncbi:AraC family transcriptional regulator [Micromonospora robiginosa]|uniref:AraC family transcriptional regulator n=1 Tax=Micromonospora robiginosa TaxID=2749844 RepID=A0A7L6B9A6_9ACTN|nr:AraC family transcriptional regulator [Micromonospora ferruginea]QLQ38411.1 AraC family transcriptional regulator [Micromonospora ferruginea]